MRRRDGRVASAVSLGLSLSLAALLWVITVSADPGPTAPPAPQSPPQPPPAETRDPVATPREPDLGVVFLPPPPEIAPKIAPEIVPEVTPEVAPADEPAAAPPEPPALAEPPALSAPAAPAAPPPVKPALPPEPQTAFRPPPLSPPPEAVAITPEAVREGRALLRLLERGEGPDIEIAWPAAAADRSDLFRLFSNCFGMRTVVMTADGEMFDAIGGRLAAGAFDGDRYSGFVRQPAGGLSVDERAQVETIRYRHGLQGGRVLRLFPRRVDAILLGALHRIAGDSFDKGVRIRARYSVADAGIRVADIDVDGRAATEIVILPYTAQRTCRTGSAG